MLVYNLDLRYVPGVSTGISCRLPLSVVLLSGRTRISLLLQPVRKLVQETKNRASKRASNPRDGVIEMLEDFSLSRARSDR
jgi:hypothetical protein